MQRFCFVFNSDGMAFTAVADYVCNFFVKSHAHLSSILHGIYNSYGLMKDSCGMGIGLVIEEDDTHESRVASLCLSWKINWQLHDLHKSSGARCTIGHDGDEVQQKNPARLASSQV